MSYYYYCLSKIGEGGLKDTFDNLHMLLISESLGMTPEVLIGVERLTLSTASTSWEIIIGSTMDVFH